MTFEVMLGDVLVGALVREEGTGIISFVVDDRYAAMPNRPVLSQQFEERRQHTVFRQASHPGQLPTFFANLLPEGALGALLAAQFAAEDKATTLAILGEDLPGAVVVRPASGNLELPPRARSFDEPGAPVAPPGDALRFSLAGVQLKFSAIIGADDHFALPFRGMGGKWILKFGSDAYPGLAENECATMDWASAVGLDVPRHRLVPLASIDGLDSRFSVFGRQVYAIERYDRLADGRRVHQEDFAQIRGYPPDHKYTGASLEGIARFIGDVCGAEDLREFLHRVLFMIVCGNTDAHMKNWSIVYPDGRAARLSPAYDFVCVRQYLPEDPLALPLAKEKSLERVGWEHVARVEKFLREHGLDNDFVEDGREFVRRCLDHWASIRGECPPAYRAAVDSLHTRLAIVQNLALTL